MAKPATTKRPKITDEQRGTTPEGRASYPRVFEADSYDPKDAKKFSIILLIEKDSDMKPILRTIKAAKIAAFGPDKSEWPDDLLSPISDGDVPVKGKDGKKEVREGYEGCWVVKLSSPEDRKPVVIDRKKNPITEKTDLYAGCYVRCGYVALAWEYMGKQGVKLSLDAVQKLREGEPFGGRRSIDDTFDDLPNEDDVAADDDKDDLDDL